MKFFCLFAPVTFHGLASLRNMSGLRSIICGGGRKSLPGVLAGD